MCLPGTNINTRNICCLSGAFNGQMRMCSVLILSILLWVVCPGHLQWRGSWCFRPSWLWVTVYCACEQRPSATYSCLWLIISMFISTVVLAIPHSFPSLSSWGGPGLHRIILDITLGKELEEDTRQGNGAWLHARRMAVVKGKGRSIQTYKIDGQCTVCHRLSRAACPFLLPCGNSCRP